MKYFGAALLCLVAGIPFLACAQSLPVPLDIRKAYDRGTRSPDGMPGPRYWQNSARYDIDVSFSPATRLVSGTEGVVYENHSPDTLKKIWFKLYPNLYKRGAPRNAAIRPGDLSGGVRISELWIDGVRESPDTARMDGTNMTLDIPPLLPGAQMRFRLGWSYVLNKTSHIRTGEVEEGSYFIAYFFPRIAVYDDLQGWNRYPYNGEQEFYNDFCHFKVAVTVPRGYLVWATGKLKNAAEVLRQKYLQRLREAVTGDSVINIIDSADLKAGGITADHPVNTWKFEASDVTDFVFALSDRYVWKSASIVVDSSTGRRTRIDAVYDPRHHDYAEVAGFARRTVQAMSFIFPAWPYPYPHETVYDGLDQMEYPMMVNDNPLKSRSATIELTDHEVFHTMFPFFMGTNETRYAFMDEGWATMGEWVISPLIDDTVKDAYGMGAYDRFAGDERDVPIMTPSTQLEGESYFLNSYPKPALGYLYVRDLLGDSLFTASLHHYIQAWHGKHPTPLNFFRCMNSGSQRNLDWFWRKWFYDPGYPDLAIGKVTARGSSHTVEVISRGDKPVPVDLSLTFEEGGVSKLYKAHRSIAVWKGGGRTVAVTVNAPGKLIKVVLGGIHDADVNAGNNVWQNVISATNEAAQVHPASK
jgi:hypothetical protein